MYPTANKITNNQYVPVNNAQMYNARNNNNQNTRIPYYVNKTTGRKVPLEIFIPVGDRFGNMQRQMFTKTGRPSRRFINAMEKGMKFVQDPEYRYLGTGFYSTQYNINKLRGVVERSSGTGGMGGGLNNRNNNGMGGGNNRINNGGMGGGMRNANTQFGGSGMGGGMRNANTQFGGNGMGGNNAISNNGSNAGNLNSLSSFRNNNPNNNLQINWSGPGLPTNNRRRNMGTQFGNVNRRNMETQMGGNMGGNMGGMRSVKQQTRFRNNNPNNNLQMNWSGVGLPQTNNLFNNAGSGMGGRGGGRMRNIGVGRGVNNYPTDPLMNAGMLTNGTNNFNLSRMGGRRRSTRGIGTNMNNFGNNISNSGGIGNAAQLRSLNNFNLNRRRRGGGGINNNMMMTPPTQNNWTRVNRGSNLELNWSRQGVPYNSGNSGMGMGRRGGINNNMMGFGRRSGGGGSMGMGSGMNNNNMMMTPPTQNNWTRVSRGSNLELNWSRQGVPYPNRRRVNNNFGNRISSVGGNYTSGVGNNNNVARLNSLNVFGNLNRRNRTRNGMGGNMGGMGGNMGRMGRIGNNGMGGNMGGELIPSVTNTATIMPNVRNMLRGTGSNIISYVPLDAELEKKSCRELQQLKRKLESLLRKCGVNAVGRRGGGVRKPKVSQRKVGQRQMPKKGRGGA